MGLIDKLIILSFAIIIIALLVVNNFNVSYQDFTIVDCDSGFCQTTDSLTGRETVVGDYLCDETVTAQAFIDNTRDYDKLYVFNIDSAAGNDLFSAEIGGHGAIVYQLFNEDASEFVSQEELTYSQTKSFDLEPGVNYRVDVYVCDLPSTLASCEDSDEGVKALIFGTTTTNFNVYQDVCSSETTLLERYCDDDNSINSKIIDCSEYGNKYVCESGACVNKGLIAQATNNLYYFIGGLVLLAIIIFFLTKKKNNSPVVGKNRLRGFTKR